MLERLRASRRDSELARQILLAIRYILPSKNPRRKRPRLAGREFFDEALRLCEIISDAEALDPALAGRPIVGEGAAPSRRRSVDEDAVAAERTLDAELERRRAADARPTPARPRRRRAQARRAGPGEQRPPRDGHALPRRTPRRRAMARAR